MGVLTSTPTGSPVIVLTTVGDSVAFPFPLQTVRWVLTTAVTSTWSLAIVQSTAVEPTGTTFGWPIVGTSTASITLGGSTSGSALANGYVDYPINNWVYGAVLSSISGGHVEFIKGAPGIEWVLKGRSYINSTALA